jgi:hypothetical protein
MHEALEDEIRRVLAGMDSQEHQEPETEIAPEDTESSTRASEEIQDIYVLVVREGERATAEPPVDALETTLAPEHTETSEPFDPGAIATVTIIPTS